MNRIFAGAIVTILVILFVGCSHSSEKTIGLLVHTTKSSRWNTDIQFINERAQVLGMKVVLCDANEDENLQLQQAKEVLKQGVDVLIVIAANQNTAAGIVREAHLYHVPVIGYDRVIRNSDLDYMVSFHYFEVGRLLVEYVAEKSPNGNCVILYGDANDGNALVVKKGIEETIQNLPLEQKLNVEYVSYVENWNYNNSNHIMNNVLDFNQNKVDAVIACNDPLGIGAYDALTAHGYKPNEVIITGQDATADFVRSMLEGGLTMSVYKPIKDLANGAVDMAYSLANNKKIEGLNGKVNNGRKEVPAILFSPSVVDQNNYKEKLIDSGLVKNILAKTAK
ncbi:MAG: sugar ABC transporter substrate-binding protein [Prolixibacteraceae bacterium]